MSKTKPNVSVVVTVLNEVDTVVTLLEGLKDQTYLPAEVVIVDGGSGDGTFSKLQNLATKQFPFKVKVFQKIGNRSVGRNAGITQAQHDLIAITDAGCLPESNWLTELVTVAQNKIQISKEKYPIIAGYYRGIARTPFEEAVIPYALVMPDRVNPEHFLPATRSLLLHRKAWELVGTFRQDLSDNEDYWFARQADQLAREPKAQIVMGFAPRAIVSWYPRSNLKSFWVMILRFARGDAYAGLWRPKVALIFARYLFVVLVLILAGMWQGWRGIFAIFLVHEAAYSIWSVIKNLKYVPRGWYWLPILQQVSDAAVMSGTILGIRGRVRK